MPSIKLVQPQDMGPRDWGVETLIVQTEQYIGKRLEMRAGTAGGLRPVQGSERSGGHGSLVPDGQRV